ncbi:hypothetical protein AB835_08180 [Candidatus Endobugula sertula]|uniref:Uncharacterized protein n=1 Tax=Candidatus Endobugula sertula TaxID=62101 RepID=A0A1D2QPS7_9GAMM|nr:hypothetical protein AB835_08180 [Candidatus Endobugula sertula]
MVEVRAHISAMELNSNGPDALVEPELPIEQDPLDEPAPAEVYREEAPADPVSEGESTKEETDPQEIFGSLWPFEDPAEVHLDPTIGRSAFRLQIQWMKANNYRFIPKQQVWVLKTNQCGGEL